MPNILSFKGKASRTEFIAVCLTTMIVTCVIGMLIDKYLLFPIRMICVITTSVLFVWIITATASRRCHDLGMSGLMQLHPVKSLILLFQKKQ